MGLRAKEVREKLGLEQQEFADALGTTLQTAHDWEHGVEPRGSFLRVMRGLEDACWKLDGKQSRFVGDRMKDAGLRGLVFCGAMRLGAGPLDALPERERDLVLAFRNLDASEQAAVAAMLKERA